MTEYQKVWVMGGVCTMCCEQKLGSDCSGNDGESNRILTLANTTVSSREIVTVDGMILRATDDYNVSHLTADSTVTFLNPIWDTQKIEVRYFA